MKAEEKPIVDIPKIDTAETVKLRTSGQGQALRFKTFVNDEEVPIDPDSEWADYEWFGLVVRELDRRDWKYGVTPEDDMYIFHWTKK